MNIIEICLCIVFLIPAIVMALLTPFLMLELILNMRQDRIKERRKSKGDVIWLRLLKKLKKN